jgi:uncharacterized tellurite resistance protein B-like protein
VTIFERVRALLQGRAPLATDGSGRPADLDLEVATVVLLLDVAYEDHEDLGVERTTILSCIEREIGIDERQALELVELAERRRSESDHVTSASARIATRYDLEQRRRIAALLWKVVYADRVVDDAEAAFADRVAHLLGLTDEDVREARLQSFSWFSQTRSSEPAGD